MSSFVPHTEGEIRSMLQELGLENLEALFEAIPAGIRADSDMGLPRGASESRVLAEIEALARRNESGLISFLGGGRYDHIIPAAIAPLISRGEFLTSYTPYQAEISQGVLQAIYEFQSMVCALTGLDVSNASLYDGDTAAAEAAVIALNASSKRKTLLYSAALPPSTKEVLQTFFLELDVRLVEIPEREGVTDTGALAGLLDDDTAGVLLASPNVYGRLEDLDGLADIIHANRSLFILSANPLSLGLFRSPGEWGADLAVGDLQPFGLPTYYGGPGVGYLAARKKFLRKMPGRIAGATVDSDGRRSFVLTLQAREQHIKRARATSNICSNQALAAVAVTIYMALLGPEGIREAARQSHAKARYLVRRLEEEAGIRLAFPGPYFNEFTLALPWSAEKAQSFLRRERGILAGIDLERYRRAAAGGNFLTAAVTEKRTRQELEAYVSGMKALKEAEHD